jgi:hypothetical protein
MVYVSKVLSANVIRLAIFFASDMSPVFLLVGRGVVALLTLLPSARFVFRSRMFVLCRRFTVSKESRKTSVPHGVYQGRCQSYLPTINCP